MFGFGRRKLLDAIAAAPDDPTPYLAYAEALGWGDRHARLIQMDGEILAGSRWPPSAAQVAARRTLLREAPDLTPPTRGRSITAPLVWFMGFVRHLALRTSATVDDVQGLLAHPSCRFLQSVDVSAGVGDGVVPLLSGRGVRPVPLRNVELEAPLALGITVERVERLATWLADEGDPRGTWLLKLVDGSAQASLDAASMAGQYGRYLSGTDADRAGWVTTLGFHEHVVLRPGPDGSAIEPSAVQALLEHVAGRRISSLFVGDDRIDRAALDAALAAANRPDVQVAPPSMGPPFPALADTQARLDAATRDPHERLALCLDIAEQVDALRALAHVPLKAHITQWADGHGREALLFGGETAPGELVQRVRELLVHPAARTLRRVVLEGKGEEAVRVVARQLDKQLEFGRPVSEPPAVCLGSVRTRDYAGDATGVAVEFGHVADWIPDGSRWDWMMHVEVTTSTGETRWLAGGTDAIDVDFSLSEAPPRSGWLAISGDGEATVTATVYLQVELIDGVMRRRAWGARATVPLGAEEPAPVLFQGISWDPVGLRPLTEASRGPSQSGAPSRAAGEPLPALETEGPERVSVAAEGMTAWLLPASRHGDLIVGWRTARAGDTVLLEAAAREGAHLTIRIHQGAEIVVKAGDRKWVVETASRRVRTVQ